ncbi:hypothetical protein [Pantoea sp. ME81]|uniref:hypothetical protein n=1 Tax=Pantoea sp. ME81 TaxID=2743935 RepID=UPI001C717013|nr:hypothetical protein [Pantoea sp. ME81]
MFDHPTQPEVAEWFASLGIEEVSYSVCGIVLTNEPPEHWFYKRNKLRPESLKLELRIPSSGNWLVDLSRHDQLFNVQWRPEGITTYLPQLAILAATAVIPAVAGFLFI